MKGQKTKTDHAVSRMTLARMTLIKAKSSAAIQRRGQLAQLWCGRPACTTNRALVPESRSVIQVGVLSDQ